MSYDSNGTLNSVCLIGRLGADPELKYATNGNAVLTMSIATDKGFEVNGQKQTKVTWHKIVVWNKLAETIAQFVRKGQRVYISGSIQTREWIPKEGGKQTVYEIVAEKVILLEKNIAEKPEKSETPQETNQEPSQDSGNKSDDMPF